MRRHAIVPLLALAVLSGCTTGQSGTPTAISTTATRTQDSTPGSESSEPSITSTSAADLPSDGAPKVENPMDVSKFVNDPCASLPPRRTQELVGAPTGTPSDDVTGVSCQWVNHSPDTFNGSSINVHFFSKVPTGLSGLYRANKRGEWEFFEPLSPIEGMPAVTYGKLDSRSSGRCAVAVGVSDTMAIDVHTKQSLSKTNRDQACSVAVMVATDVVKTLKAG
ncbi:DUF3558 domain-containing protein [Actinokineospora iranica]|uniref:DUF3558 domain-containing protein n=1 Tax=Actinokineospora iranica TaxID=1271860 RepID=A0A1G6Q0C2_9PSEU|nr:DUF3558 domain-containing protein [Actinokineospora iranica]SDC85758.1 Protein of unknown function [Actinokineospora iranica]